jgi:hypothetical protein
VDAVRRSYQWLAIGNLLVMAVALLAAFWGQAAVWPLSGSLLVAAGLAWREHASEEGEE